MNLGCFPLRLDLYLLPQLRATDAAAEPSTLLGGQMFLIIFGESPFPSTPSEAPTPLTHEGFCLHPQKLVRLCCAAIPLVFPSSVLETSE